jgi:hypothetical protein
MVMRAILLVVLASFLFSGVVRADDAPKLTGSSLKIKNAVSKSIAVFVGTVRDLGLKAPDPPTTPANGPVYNGVKVKVLKVLKGSVESQASVSLFVDFSIHEELHKVESSYIFFVSKNTATLSSIIPPDSFFVVKLLPATEANIAMVKMLISN